MKITSMTERARNTYADDLYWLLVEAYYLSETKDDGYFNKTLDLWQVCFFFGNKVFLYVRISYHMYIKCAEKNMIDVRSLCNHASG